MGTLWFGGTFYTMEQPGKSVEAVYVVDGYIKAVGTEKEIIETYKDEIEEQRDIDGAYAFPGFIDSHLHMVGHGEKLIRLDLSNVTSAEEMKDLLVSKSSDAQPGEWIYGEGWNENNFPDRKIFHREELDEIAPHNPMMLTRVCRHAVLVNSTALDAAKINKTTTDPDGGVIVRDGVGTPTGYLLDSAQELVKEVAPEVTEAYLEKALTTAVDDMFSLGLVGGHTEDLGYYGDVERPLQTFKKVIDGEKRKLRTHMLVHHTVVEDLLTRGYKIGEHSKFIELGPMKIFADGALGGRTALLSQPYNDAPETSGVAIHPLNELKEMVRSARERKMAVAIHTIGDLALEYAIEAIETHPNNSTIRDRLIHIQVAREDLLERMFDLPVILDIQPRFVAADFPWVEERLGFERLPLSFAWKTLLDKGLHCAGGSDAPIEPVDPLLGIHAAVTRKKPGESHEGYLPEQKLSIFEAVSLFTTGSAYAIGKEAKMGKVQPGYVADFTLLDKDLFSIEPDEILDTKVVKTVVDNTIMYER
ncbi:amidohydrolase [Bacillus sp. FJAT-45350]|uniref:amidohydrolase n=1 Tax=Bacillus sp. FJAT-45350 TaxID=2011014 RepID=UPI000BB96229|nr:amidohydrolase [Bacillus sp. FJAT-45350]